MISWQKCWAVKGMYNEVLVSVQRGADLRPLKLALDRATRPWGSIGSFDRSRHPSAMTLDGELQQLKGMAIFAPLIFLSISAFLINLVLSRLIEMQRTTIAVLKALGYTDRRVAAHYLLLALLFVTGGLVIGVALGSYLGSGLTTSLRHIF